VRPRVALIVMASCALAAAGCSGTSERTTDATTATTVATATTSLQTRTAALDDGGTARIRDDGRVTVLGPGGHLTGSSGCPDGQYDDAVDLFEALQHALRTDDRVALVGLLSYPLRWNHNSDRTVIEDPQYVEAHYEEIFTAPAVDAILAADASAVFCNWQSFMLGDGVVWGNSDTGGRDLIKTLNVPS
jgi:hypothetical protein